MRTELFIAAQRYFAEHLKVDIDTLLTPIEGTEPGGASLRANGVYRAIQEARRQDDPTVPLGPWTHELKRADWAKVADVALDALAKKTKDLQLAVWLLEAEIHRRGFGAIAPCLMLIERLCAYHWEYLYPRGDGDIEHRANLFHWANEKLLPVLRLVPITNAGREARELNWSDWESAKRKEQLKNAPSPKTRGADTSTTVGTLEFGTTMAGTSTDWHRLRYRELADAIDAVAMLSETLDQLCGDESPTLHAFSTLLEQIQTLIVSELHKRGVQPEEEPAPEADAVEGDASELTPAEQGRIYDRATAYAQLAAAADYLMRLEPHSPAPYLVKRAIAWGNLNTAELYQELFMKYGGQLNIFEMLGLQTQARADNQ